MFDSTFMSQIGKGTKTLEHEILEILVSNHLPQSCDEMYKQSTIAGDRESLSRQVVLTRKAGLLELIEMRKREGFRDVGFYQITEAGKAYLATHSLAGDEVSETAATPQSEVESVTSNPITTEDETMNQSAPSTSSAPVIQSKKVTTKDIRAIVIGRPGIEKQELYKILTLPDQSNKKKIQDMVSYMITNNQLRVELDGDKTRIHLGQHVKKAKQAPKVKTPIFKVPDANPLPVGAPPQPLFIHTPASAPHILHSAVDCIGNRAAERDQPNGERSMARTVASFNAMSGHNLTEQQGWMFMAMLKMARSQGGKHKLDDYIDGAAYMALSGEAAEAA